VCFDESDRPLHALGQSVKHFEESSYPSLALASGLTADLIGQFLRERSEHHAAT
jgi:hypothetical protein